MPSRRELGARRPRARRRRPRRRRCRSRRSPVSTRSVRPGLGVDEGQLADVDERLLARVDDLDGEDRVAAGDLGQRRAASRAAPRKSEMIDDEAGGRARRGDDAQSARGIEVAPPPSSGGSAGERAEQAEHARRGRRPAGVDALAAGAEGDDAEAVARVGRRSARRRAPRPRPRRPCAGRRSRSASTADVVEQEPRGQLAVRHVLADLRDEAAGRGVPVDAPDVVARLVRPDAVELEAVARGRGRGGRRSSGHRRAASSASSSWRTSSSAIGPGPGPGGGAVAAADPGEVALGAVAAPVTRCHRRQLEARRRDEAEDALDDGVRR